MQKEDSLSKLFIDEKETPAYLYLWTVGAWRVSSLLFSLYGSLFEKKEDSMRTPHTYTRQSLAYRLKRLRFLDTFCCKEATRPKVLTLFVIVIKVLVLDEFKVIIVKIFLDLSLVICKDSQQLLTKRTHAYRLCPLQQRANRSRGRDTFKYCNVGKFLVAFCKHTSDLTFCK